MQEATHQLQTYRWDELWQTVRHLQSQPGTQHTPALALKAMLLAGWWQDLDAARHILGRCKPPKPDALSHFNKKDTHFNCLNKQHSLNSCQNQKGHPL